MNSTCLKFIRTLLLATLACFVVPVVAAEPAREKLFSSNDPIQVEIQASWRQILRKEDDTRWPATLLMTDSTGEARSIPLTVERRGKSRQDTCDFPPIRMRFNKNDAKGTIFQGEGALKLVTHCDDGYRWTQYYVREMLAYRLYNLITDYSFRVRPFAIRYRDPDRDSEPDEQFAFVIEDIDEVADRFDLVELELESTVPSRMDPVVASQMSLFQYMIGNLDWSPLRGPDACCHNTKLIGYESAEPPLIPVPYDFDASGFVDAHYAVPPAGSGVRSVTTRLFRGYCRHNDTLPAARQLFLIHEQEMLTLVQNETRLNDRSRNKTLKYLEDFFEVLSDDKEFEKEITSECRG